MQDNAQKWLVETGWLGDRLDAPGLVVVDGSMHLPTSGRGIPVAITYVVTGVTAFVVIGAAIVAVVNAAVQLVDALPTIIPRIGLPCGPRFGPLLAKPPPCQTAGPSQPFPDWLTMFRKRGGAPGFLPVRSSLSRRCVCVPCRGNKSAPRIGIHYLGHLAESTFSF